MLGARDGRAAIRHFAEGNSAIAARVAVRARNERLRRDGYTRIIGHPRQPVRALRRPRPRRRRRYPAHPSAAPQPTTPWSPTTAGRTTASSTGSPPPLASSSARPDARSRQARCAGCQRRQQAGAADTAGSAEVSAFGSGLAVSCDALAGEMVSIGLAGPAGRRPCLYTRAFCVTRSQPDWYSTGARSRRSRSAGYPRCGYDLYPRAAW